VEDELSLALVAHCRHDDRQRIPRTAAGAAKTPKTVLAPAESVALFDGKAETLAASLDRIQKAAAEIIAALHDAAEQAEAA
jgi:hypothetical protein